MSTSSGWGRGRSSDRATWSRAGGTTRPNLWPSALRPSVLGDHAQIASYHYIDCVDTLELGSHAAIAGFRSTVLTHSIDLIRDTYVVGPVVLGEYAVVMSGCMLLAGTRVPSRSIVSAGSVVDTKLSGEFTLFRGNPAVAVRDLPERLGFFHRGRLPTR